MATEVFEALKEVESAREDAVEFRSGWTSCAAPVCSAMRESSPIDMLALSGWSNTMDTTRKAVRTAENRPA